jgi:hypothetical protein
MAPEEKATPSEMRVYFEADGGPKLTASEIMTLKKADPDGYDNVAIGVKNGTLTY